MGVFGDNLRKYHEIGLSCIPIKADTKRPIFNGWQKYCDALPTDLEIADWETRYADNNKIGLCLGKASQVVAFDYDYDYDEQKVKIERDEFEKDEKRIQKQILSMLPQSPCVKAGKKGWTRFYKWTPLLDENSNISCDRNGVRLFDFLSWHKQTIIPPSIHSINQLDGKVIFYKWIGEPIDECLSDLPEIDLSVVEDIRALYGNAEKTKTKSRHETLLSFILLSLKITKNIDKTVERLIIKDSELYGDKCYLTDRKHHQTTDAKTNATKWVTRVNQWSGEKSVQKEIKQLFGNDQETFFEFFRQILPEHKKEILSGRVLYKETYRDNVGRAVDEWKSVDNKIKSIRSDAIEVGLNRALVEDHLSKYQDSLEPSFLFKIPEWDGKDRLDLILRLVPASNYVVTGQGAAEYERTHAQYAEIVKHICAGIFRRAFDNREQNISPILTGAQGKGKNTFLESVFGMPFGDFYWDNITISQDQQKNYDAVDGKLVCIIGEFDQTSKVQISHIKELITNSRYSARRAYDRRSDSYRLHHTIMSASNFENVLKDTSGNRRFVIFQIDYINWEYSEHCDKEQLLAQYYHLYKTNFKMSEDTYNLMRQKVETLTPDDPIESAIEFYKKKFKILVTKTQDEWVTSGDVVDLLREVEMKTGVKNQWIRNKLKRLGMAKRTNAGVKFRNLHAELIDSEGLNPSP